MNMIYNIVYVSKALHAMAIEDLNILLDQSRSRNKNDGITGMLLYIEGQEPGKLAGRFMQVIEGDESDVVSLFNKIKTDARHEKVTTLHEGRLNKRNFKTWSMGFKTLSLDMLRKAGYLNFEASFVSNTRPSNFNVALHYLKSFYEMKI
ncbi:BLUF domain-containing protein [Mucilaginibacter sp. PAMB04274]|uniref:BLUF domain-containing protein n=1 Tax=Mucilaginibacter sp. PAMB04274 TaxID=3138568 RepID=UPI0031F6112C